MHQTYPLELTPAGARLLDKLLTVGKPGMLCLFFDDPDEIDEMVHVIAQVRGQLMLQGVEQRQPSGKATRKRQRNEVRA